MLSELSHWKVWFAMAALMLSWSCSDSTGTDAARLTVAVTDAPHPFLGTAIVTIGAVDIVPVGTGGPIRLTENGGTLDLLQLQDGATAQIASLEVPEGQYHQLRVVVEAASVTLKDELQFADGTTVRELVVPSGAQSGIKINLSDTPVAPDAGVRIAGGETVLVVDFDVRQNFVPQGDPNSLIGLRGVLFTPLLRAVVRDVAGSISGSVTDAAGLAVTGAAVRAVLRDPGTMEVLQTAEATGVTDNTGAFTVRFLAPGTYLVTVETNAGTAANQTVTVGNGEDVSDVAFVVTR